MKALEKLVKVKRLYRRLENVNRENESYKDDLFSCFIECWSVQDWLKNDGELKECYPDIKSQVNQYVENNDFIKMSFDIANREKHLVLRNKRANGKIDHSNIGVHYAEHISVKLSVDIKLIHVDDLVEYDARKKSEKNVTQSAEILGDQTNSTMTKITQEYIVTNNKGEYFNALYVIEKTIEAWEAFIDSL